MPIPAHGLFDPTVTWSVVVTLLIFVLTYLLNIIRTINDSRNRRRKLLLALKVEISENIARLREANQQYPGHHVVGNFMREHSGLAPHMDFFYLSDIYENNIGLVSALETAVIQNIVTFYANLAYISALVVSMQRPSFSTISPEGREKLMFLIKETLATTEEKGSNLIAAFSLLLSDGPK